MPGDLRPSVLVLDVDETVTDMSPLAARLEDVGLPGRLLPTWFAGVLRDGMAVTLAGGTVTFAAVARDGLRTLLAQEGGFGSSAAARRKWRFAWSGRP
ncbi:hypothetical protein ABZ281_28580 [Streptomyces sp. NPDC006265]|uniref:hypothetical protein n=1 Tax=Streptomyces sp. NPDC006265 TaxID=3156740 RepID=UPI0033B891BD